MPIGIPVFFFETARTSLSAMVGGGGSRLAGGSRRCARLPACWLSAAARGLAIGGGSRLGYRPRLWPNCDNALCRKPRAPPQDAAASSKSRQPGAPSPAESQP